MVSGYVRLSDWGFRFKPVEPGAIIEFPASIEIAAIATADGIYLLVPCDGLGYRQYDPWGSDRQFDVPDTPLTDEYGNRLPQPADADPSTTAAPEETLAPVDSASVGDNEPWAMTVKAVDVGQYVQDVAALKSSARCPVILPAGLTGGIESDASDSDEPFWWASDEFLDVGLHVYEDEAAYIDKYGFVFADPEPTFSYPDGSIVSVYGTADGTAVAAIPAGAACAWVFTIADDYGPNIDVLVGSLRTVTE
ncbi:MAG: hypothetical protein JWM34_1293 [Ilumatobacteraceae bacterium]|nr:hypothetical protein [Ilumatobacteraceae bacterium]